MNMNMKPLRNMAASFFVASACRNLVHIINCVSLNAVSKLYTTAVLQPRLGVALAVISSDEERSSQTKDGRNRDRKKTKEKTNDEVETGGQDCAEHTVHTVVNRSGPSARCIECRVPQESAPSPVVFMIYIRDIPKPEDRRIFNAIYASDTAIVTISRYFKIAAGLAKVHLTKIEELLSALVPQDQSEKDAKDYVHLNSSRAATKDYRCQNGDRMERHGRVS
ncbi:hypothetical protein Trydic_g17582 [Trypoxylus dichotomus]